MKEEVQEADLAVINQETILVADKARVSSFPAFGSPSEVGEAIADAGFRVVTQASNHSLDKGLEGIHDSIAFWKEKEPQVKMLGLHTSAVEQDKIPVITVGGIRIALLNYTEKLNYHMIPASEPWCLDVMKKNRRRKIRQQIRNARRISDFVVVLPHWGCEYLYEPVPSQKEWAVFFAKAGADLIIGTHPHVVQPTEWLMGAGSRMTLCIYSLGNFVSCQVKAGTMLGAMADVVIEKKGRRARIVSDELVPLVTHTDENYSYFTTYFLNDYTDDLAEKNKIFRIVKRDYGFNVDCGYLRKLFADILEGKAQENNEFQKPFDVTKSNIRGVVNAVLKKNTKE